MLHDEPKEDPISLLLGSDLAGIEIVWICYPNTSSGNVSMVIFKVILASSGARIKKLIVKILLKDL